MRLFHPLALLLMVLVLPGCSLVKGWFSWLAPHGMTKPRSPIRESLLERLTPSIRSDFERLVPRSGLHGAVMSETAESLPARFKRRLVLDSLKQPWEGMADLEGHGLLVAEIAEGGASTLPGLLDVLEAGMDR